MFLFHCVDCFICRFTILFQSELDFDLDDSYSTLSQSGEVFSGFNAVRGRCFIAGRDFEVGEIILYGDAFAWVPRHRFLEVTCSYCGSLCLAQVVRDQIEGEIHS